MPRYKLVLEYDGTAYVGWQVQPNGPSLERAVERALETFLGQRTPTWVAGRTDAGVHARGQVVAIDSSLVLPPQAFISGLNALLPSDIAVVRADVVPDSFDPRRDTRGKRYLYRITNRKSRAPLSRAQTWELFAPLALAPMQEAAKSLLGTHDFTSFRASNCQAKHAVRELRKVDIRGDASGEIVFTVEGTAFLKHMVRNIVGSLVEVGRGKRPPAWVREVLEARNRSLAGPTAPPQGLCLDEVFYAEDPTNLG